MIINISYPFPNPIPPPIYCRTISLSRKWLANTICLSTFRPPTSPRNSLHIVSFYIFCRSPAYILELRSLLGYVVRTYHKLATRRVPDSKLRTSQHTNSYISFASGGSPFFV